MYVKKNNSKKNSDFYLKYWCRYSTLKTTHFEGMDNLMKRLIPLVPTCALYPSDPVSLFVEATKDQLPLLVS